MVESLPLLVDDLPVICQGVEQSLSLRDYQAPAEIRSRDRDKDHSVHLGHRQASKHQWFSGSGYLNSRSNTIAVQFISNTDFFL